MSFQEAGYLYVFVEHVWDINHLFDEKGTLGSVMKGLFGYNGNPSATGSGDISYLPGSGSNLLCETGPSCDRGTGAIAASD